MKRRKLGNSGLEVAPLALGGNVFGWTADEPTTFKILDAFVAAGCNLIDTADIYSRWVPGNMGGESETVLGKWLRRSGNRGKVLIATKVGMEMGPDRKGLSKSYILRGGGFAEAPADGLHRSVPVTYRRPRDTAGRNPGGVRTTDPAGKGPGDRRFELHRGPANAGIGSGHAIRISLLPMPATFIQPLRSCGL